MAKLACKPLSRQLGRRPNTFSCSICKLRFRVRRKLELHKTHCRRDYARQHGLQHEMGIRLGFARIPIIPPLATPSQQQVYQAIDKVMRWEEDPVGRKPHLHHVCKICRRKFASAEKKRDHFRTCR